MSAAWQVVQDEPPDGKVCRCGFTVEECRERPCPDAAFDPAVREEIARLMAEPCDCEGDFDGEAFRRRTCARCARLIEFGVTPPERVS